MGLSITGQKKLLSLRSEYTYHVHHHLSACSLFTYVVGSPSILHESVCFPSQTVKQVQLNLCKDNTAYYSVTISFLQKLLLSVDLRYGFIIFSGEVFSASVDLPAGEYLYKYIVDEQWVVNKNQVKYAFPCFSSIM